MELTSQQQRIVIEKLGKMIGKRPCSSCGANIEFSINSRIFELREFNKGSLVIGGNTAVVPLVVVTCPKCGETKLYNALMLGLLKQEKNIDEK